jgi:hypothetical protein
MTQFTDDMAKYHDIFPIEVGVPHPGKRKAHNLRGPNKTQRTMETLQIGQSFITDEPKATCYNIERSFKCKEFVFKTLSSKHVRVWRLA